ncbi:glycoside hydrolase family 19 protein [Salmonella enterica subsp. houtenae]
MADGTIAAYRINNDYLKGPYKGQELRYSSTFVLVKSQCQPDPQKEKSWLEFYSLYMHLAPVKDYPASLCYKVRAGHSGILLRKYTSGQNGLPETQESGDPVIYQAPPKTRNSLKAGDRFASSCTGRFYVTKGEQSTLMTFGLVRLLNGETAGNEQYWVTLDPTLMEPDGEIQALMPAWMQKAKAKGVFDQVQAGGETEEWQVSAGTPVGFMGCEEYPGKEGSQTEREWFVHLEVLSADPRMPAFLGNPEGVKGEKRTVRAPKGKILYTRQVTAEQATFSATSATLEAQYMLPRITTTPVMDASKQWWFNITGSGWLPEKDVEEAGQYDLLKQGFQPLEENSGGDMVSSPYEGWVPEAFDSVSRAAAQGDEWYEQVLPFYRELMVRMDSDQDGKVTEEEIRQALVVRDPLVRHVVNRLVIKHHSEWCGGRSTGRWEEFYRDLDTEETAYCEKWQSDLEWMSGVPPFNTDEPVWHFHPVVFLDVLKPSDNGVTYEQLKKVFPQASDADLNTVVEELRGKLTIFKLDTPTRLRHFFSQIKGEVGSKMKGRTESFQFSPATLRSFSSYYRTHPLESEEDGYEKNLAGIFIRRANEQSIGRKHYLRLNGNRQSNPDDGYNFRGRGLIQVTGYEKYHSFMEEYYKYWQGDAPDTVSEPEKINEMPYAIRSALWFWLHYEVYLLDYGKGYNDVVDVTKRVNGGSMGLDERQTAYTLCEKVFL